MSNKFFNIFIDTGGTFTDCIASDERGNIYRQKFLSNSTLRSTILKELSGNTFQISDDWNLKRDILKGFSFRFMNDTNQTFKVESFDVELKNHQIEH